MGAAVIYKAYYVSSGGSDTNTGTATSPFKSIDRGWSVVKPGDTIRIVGRIELSKPLYLSGKSGTSTIRFVVEGINCTITRAANYKYEVAAMINFTGNYVHFRNIELTGMVQKPGEHADPAFRATNSSNNIWESINYHTNGAAFSIKGNSNNNLIKNSDFHHIQDPYSSDPYDGGDGINIHDCTGSGNVVTGCRAYWNSDDGFDFWNNTGTVTIENCWSFYNGYLPGTFTPAGNGTGIKLGGGESATSTVKRTVNNNLCYNNAQHGIVQNNAISALITNNTVVKTGSHGIWTGSWGGGPCEVKGNVVYKAGGDAIRSNTRDKVTGNYTSMKDADFASLDEKQLLAPRLADGSLPGLTFLKTTTGVGAVFNGTPGGPVEPPKDPNPPTATLEFTIHVYTDKSINKSKKPTATKELWFDVEVYSDGAIKKK